MSAFFVSLGVLLLVTGLSIGWGTLKGREYLDVTMLRERFSVLAMKTNSYSRQIGEITKIIKNLESIKYSKEALKQTLLSELSDCGMIPSELILREADATMAGTVASNSRTVVLVEFSGIVPMDKLDFFLRRISSREKVWGIVEFEMNPKESSVSLIGRYEDVRKRNSRSDMEVLVEQIREALKSKSTQPVEISMKMLVIVG